MLWLFVGLSVFNQVRDMVHNVAGSSDTVQTDTTAALDPAVVSQAAGAYATDYLSHDPTRSAADGDVWQGLGWSAVTLVVPGPVQMLSPTQAVAALSVRLDLAMPTSSTSAPAQATASPIPGAAQSTDVPKGYQRKASVWVPVRVSATQGADGTVTAEGAVFGADPAAPPLPSAAIDSAATSETKEYATALLTSYAQSATTTEYLTAPGVELSGLGGVVTPLNVTAWSLSEPTPAGLRQGTATVRWSFKPAGVDLAVLQTYDLAITQSQGRWFTTTISPSTPEGSSK